MTDQNDIAPGIDRRSFLGRSSAAVAALPLAAGTAAPAQAARAGGTTAVEFKVNGREVRLAVDPRVTLLDALREQVGLTGSKKGCDHGQCGACTVHLDGQRVLGCLTLAVQASGHEVTTIEGLQGTGGALHPMQQAFIDNDALQCGYCTPGQIMAAVAAVKEGHARSDDEIREYMSGNLCRCAAYPNIVAAIRQAAPQMARS